MELVKENIEYEQLLGENTADTVVKEEYVIPDTHPDVRQVLMLDAKPIINIKEVLQDKVYLEGQIQYTILYMAKEEDKTEAHSVTYNAKYSNTIDISGAMGDMLCETECYIEHMECIIVNERKVCVEGVLKLKAEVYKKYDINIIKDVTGADNVQFLKNPTAIDKIIDNISAELIGKAHMQISVDKPEIYKVIKHNINLHKKEIKLLDGKIQIDCIANITMLYKGKDSRDINYIEDEVLVTKQIESPNLNSYMDEYTELRVDAVEFNVKEDDLGEKRIVDVEFLVKANTKVMFKQEMDMIEDVYSPSLIVEMDRKDYDMNIIQGQVLTDSIVKAYIEVEDEAVKPTKIIMNNATVCITDRKVLEDKVVVEGILNVNVLYKSNDEEKYVATAQEEIPFTCAIEMAGTKINMNCVCKAYLESIDVDIEAGNISVRAIVKVYCRVNYVSHRKFLVSVNAIEGEIPPKKASVTIYSVQAGDTLWKIAKKYNTTIEVIAKINDIENPNEIKVGEKLIIPGRAII